MSEANDQPAESTTREDNTGEAQRAASLASRPTSELVGESSGAAGPPALVEQLAAAFREQVKRALGVELSDELGSTALAFVDHYLALLRDETREPIVSLVAANAGAWFGELVRREIGGQWIGDGTDPRRLRLLLEPAFVYFSPVDLACEAILSGSPALGDPRVPEDTSLDAIYHLRKRPLESFEHEPADHDWIAERLAECPPVPEDQFFSLTGRFETLQMILELLASREIERGREPTLYHLNDYVAAVVASPASDDDD
jgi:hypothetical protein